MNSTTQKLPLTPPAAASTIAAAKARSSSATETIAVTVLLTNDQAALLDETSTAIRRANGVVIRRSAMLRAIVSAVLPFRHEWLKCPSAADLEQKIANRLQADATYAVLLQRARAAQKP